MAVRVVNSHCHELLGIDLEEEESLVVTIPAVRPTQPLIQWAPVHLPSGRKFAREMTIPPGFMQRLQSHGTVPPPARVNHN